MTAPDRISASTAKDLQRCLRYVWYKRVAKQPTPVTEAQHLGSSVHALAEAHLMGAPHPTTYTSRDGQDRPLHSRAHAVYLPAVEVLDNLRTMPGIVVEQELTAQCGPLPYLGYVDAMHGATHDTPRIFDHKTRSKRKAPYIPTDDTIAEDIQMRGYAFAAFHHDPPAGVWLCHINYLTKPKTGQPYEVWTTAGYVAWADVLHTWSVVYLPAAVQLAYLHSVTDPEEVPHGAPRACWAYGSRCPYWDQCSAAGQPKYIPRIGNG
jgi:hypothetical protein